MGHSEFEFNCSNQKYKHFLIRYDDLIKYSFAIRITKLVWSRPGGSQNFEDNQRCKFALIFLEAGQFFPKGIGSACSQSLALNQRSEVMMPIKIECPCGQRFAFEVEPVNGQMPSPVTCPACGTEATSAANEIIARSHPVQSIPVAVRASAVVTASPAPRPNPAKRLPGQVEPAQAEKEAKAKILWGDSKDEVAAYLRLNGFSANDASEIVETAFKERAAAVRAEGFRKIFTGVGLMCVPVVSFIIMLSLRVIFIKLLALAIVAGLWGVYKALDGTLMALAPKSEKGEIYDN